MTCTGEIDAQAIRALGVPGTVVVGAEVPVAPVLLEAGAEHEARTTARVTTAIGGAMGG